MARCRTAAHRAIAWLNAEPELVGPWTPVVTGLVAVLPLLVLIGLALGVTP